MHVVRTKHFSRPLLDTKKHTFVGVQDAEIVAGCVCVCVVDIYDFLHVFLNIRLNMDT